MSRPDTSTVDAEPPSLNEPQRTIPPGVMAAVVQPKYGSPDVLEFVEDTPTPTPRANEVLVKVHAAGVDRGTLHMLNGDPYIMRYIGFGLRRPKNPVPGLDVAGVVVQTGSTVTRFHAGDAVFGVAHGSFAEYACAREDRLVKKPANLTFEQVAIVGVSGCAALHAVRSSGRIKPGKRVLVLGATGGVGHYVVQLAKAFGAHVTGVTSTDKVDFVGSLGVDRVIDYKITDFLEAGDLYDVIIDIVGIARLSSLRRCLTRKGTLVIVGGQGRWTGVGRQVIAVLLSTLVPQRLKMFVSTPRLHDLEELACLVADGRVTPVVDATYSLRDAPEALRALAGGHSRGKITIAT